MLPKKVYLTPKNITLFSVCALVILIIVIGITFIVSLSIFKSILIHKIKNTSKKYANTLSDEIIYVMKHQCDSITEYFTFDTQLTEHYLDSVIQENEIKSKYDYDFTLAKFLILLCENVTMTNCINSNDIVLPSSFDKNLITILYGKTKHTNNVVIYGYLFYDTTTKTTFLIWSGTATARMWISDLNFRLTSFPHRYEIKNKNDNDNDNDDIKVHEGYLNIYLKFKKQILQAWTTLYKDKSSFFIIAGHSLGGALTYISAFDLTINNLINVPTIVHTFGSPRAGNTDFASKYNKLPLLKSIRIFNTEDIIPYVPLPIIQNEITGQSYLYEHCDAKATSFTVNLGSNVSNHCESYISYLPK